MYIHGISEQSSTQTVFKRVGFTAVSKYYSFQKGNYTYLPYLKISE